MSLNARWKAAKETYAKATKEKKPGGIFEKLFGTGIESALSAFDKVTTPKAAIDQAGAVSKMVLPYVKTLADAAGKEKDANKKKAIVALKGSLQKICEDITIMMTDIASISNIDGIDKLKHNQKLFNELYNYAKTESSTENLDYLKDYWAGKVRGDALQVCNKFIKEADLNIPGNLKKRMQNAAEELHESGGDPKLHDAWMKLCDEAAKEVAATVKDTWGRFKLQYVAARLKAIG